MGQVLTENTAHAKNFKEVRGLRELLIRIIPLIILVINLLIHIFLPHKQVASITNSYTTVLIAGIIAYSIVFSFSLKSNKFWSKLRNKALLLTPTFLFLTIWDLATLKFALLRIPYFPGPDKVLSVFATDAPMLLDCTANSLVLLLTGFGLGMLIGLTIGTLMGWYQRCNFWIAPYLRIIGPIPAMAWLPLAIVAFPTSFSASVFLIALAVQFPVTIMTSSGIANVEKSYFEVAKTLGGDEKYLVFKVAIPAAMPMIFIGLFMGMSASFLTLIAAEMLGVKAGLGWYINWAQGWADYYKVYAALILIAVVFSGLIALLFKVRDKLLVWQKGLIRW
jgi:NitT/TauT family transport system permease protein